MSGIEIYPRWANHLANQVLKSSHVDNAATVIFYLPKNGKRRCEVMGGHARVSDGLIELMTQDAEETDYKRWVVLHEAAHFIDHFHNGRQYLKPDKYGRRRCNHHPQSFWDIAIPLYQKHDVVAHALEHEYAKGQKLIRALRRAK